MYLQDMDAQLQQIGGGYAGQWGQTYDVRRMDGATNIAIQTNSPVLPGFLASIKRTTDKKIVESVWFDLLPYISTCDNTNLQLGDQFTETGFKATSNGVYVLAQMRPARPTVFMQVEHQASFTRVNPAAGRLNQQAGGVTAPADYAANMPQTESPLYLTSGVYSFTGSGNPAQIRIGLQPTNRVNDDTSEKVQITEFRERFVCFIPLFTNSDGTQGIVPQENDHLVIAQPLLNKPDRYKIMVTNTGETTGLAGYVCIVEKIPN